MILTARKSSTLPLPATLGDVHAFRGMLRSLLFHGGTAIELGFCHNDVECLTKNCAQVSMYDPEAAKRLLGSAGFPQFSRHWPTVDELWFALAPTEHAALMLIAATIGAVPELSSLLREGKLQYELRPQHDLTYVVSLTWPATALVLSAE